MEAKLLTRDNAMAQVLWTRHFLAAQGEYVPITTVYQDNKSTIIAGREWKTIKQLVHQTPKIRFFFVTDKIKKVKSKGSILPDTHKCVIKNSICTAVQVQQCMGVCWRSKNLIRKLMNRKKSMEK